MSLARADAVALDRADTLAGCNAILDGEADDWAESSLYMIGNLDEARQKEAAATKTEHLL